VLCVAFLVGHIRAGNYFLINGCVVDGLQLQRAEAWCKAGSGYYDVHRQRAGYVRSL